MPSTSNKKNKKNKAGNKKKKGTRPQSSSNKASSANKKAVTASASPNKEPTSAEALIAASLLLNGDEDFKTTNRLLSTTPSSLVAQRSSSSSTTTAAGNNILVHCKHGWDTFCQKHRDDDAYGDDVVPQGAIAIRMVEIIRESIYKDASMFVGYLAAEKGMVQMKMKRREATVPAELIGEEEEEDDDDDETSAYTWLDVIPKENYDRILEIARSLLLFLGTQHVLDDGQKPHTTEHCQPDTANDAAAAEVDNITDGANLMFARMFAQAVSQLETFFHEEYYYHDTIEKIQKERWALMRDISDRDELIITAFYAKRIPCSCLDE
eukprot:scaffold28_cov73-Cylindrotheca_fusiformis.AAC.1